MALKKVQKTSKMNPMALLNEKKCYADRIQEELELKNMPIFSLEDTDGDKALLHIDRNYLSLPINITDISTKELGEYLNAYTQQKVYLRTLLGWTECMQEEARREYFEASEVKYRELSKTKLSETAKEREVNSDEDILPSYEKYMDFKKKLQILNLNIASIEDIIFLISREVSRRTGDFSNERRDYNVQKH